MNCDKFERVARDAARSGREKKTGASVHRDDPPEAHCCGQILILFDEQNLDIDP